MATSNFANPDNVPLNALRSLEALTPEERDFAKSYLECSDDLRAVVHSMFAVLDNENATEGERFRALTTIADTLYLNPHKGMYGMNLVDSESEVAEVNTQLAREVQRMDQEEQTFAERLRELLDRRHISQSELADRIGVSQSAISHMLKRNARPQKKTILKLAETLQVDPIALWPDLEVAEILDSVASFQEERQLTPTQAASLRGALDRPPAKVKAQRLPSRRHNR